MSGRLVTATTVVAVNLGVGHLAEFAFLDDRVARLDQMRCAAALSADLDDALVLPRRRQHGLALGHIHADRFLHINIRPGFDGGDHRQRMPMVRRADEHDVQVLFLEHLPVVVVGARRLL